MTKRSPEAPTLSPPSVLRGFGVSNGRRCAVIRVSVTYGDLQVDADFEADHYTALLATLRHMWEMQGNA